MHILRKLTQNAVKATAAWLDISLILQLLLAPALFVLSPQPVIAATEPQVAFSYNADASEFSLHVEPIAELDYTVTYSTSHGITDGFQDGGSATDGVFAATRIAGTSSSDHDTHYGVVSGSLEIVGVKQEGGEFRFERDFTIQDGQLVWDFETVDEPGYWSQVELGQTYQAVEDNRVSVTFTELPDPAGDLRIRQVELSDEQVADLGALTNIAYEITSSMEDGTFAYDLTLPNPQPEKKATIQYSEDGTTFNDAGEEEHFADTVTVRGLDHFTVFVVTGGASPTFSEELDAITGTDFTVDNGDTDYSENDASDWKNSSNSCRDEAIDSDGRWTSNQEARAYWNFQVPVDGKYQVFAHWLKHGNQTENANYILKQSGSELTNSVVSQKGSPDCSASGWTGISNGVVTLQANTDYTVLLQHDPADKNGHLYADAIRVVLDQNTGPNVNVTEPSTPDTYVSGAFPASFEASDVPYGIKSYGLTLRTEDKSYYAGCASNTDVAGTPETVSDGCSFDTTSHSDGKYWVRAAVQNANGQWKSDLEPIYFDNTKPSGTIIAPQPNSYIGRNYVMHGTMDDNLSGVERVEVRFKSNTQNKLIKKYDADYDAGTKTWTITLNNGIHDVPEDNYIAKAVGYDKAGNARWLNHANVTVDITRPTVSFVQPDNGDIFAGTFTVELSAHDTNMIDRMAVNLYDNNGNFLQPCGSIPSSINELSKTLTCDIDTTSLSDGQYKLKGGAFDLANNNNTVSTSFTVDNTAPTITIISPHDHEEVSGDVLLKGTIEDPSGIDFVTVIVGEAGGPNILTNRHDFDADPQTTPDTFTYTGDEFFGEFETYWDTTTVPDGKYKVKFRSKDNKGNTAFEMAYPVHVNNYGDVTVCKEDPNANRLAGWRIGLFGEKLDTVTVPSTGTTVTSNNLSAENIALVANGTYTYWPAQLPEAGIADAGHSLRPEGNNNPGPGAQWIAGDSLGGNWTGYLEVQVDGNNVDWGSFSSDHRYLTGLSLVDSTLDFSIVDSGYGDNSGDITVDIYDGWVRTTDETGCTTFEDVLFGEYTLTEGLQDGWTNVSELEQAVVISEDEQSFTIVNTDAQAPDAPTILFPDHESHLTSAALTQVDWTDVFDIHGVEYQYQAMRKSNYTSSRYLSSWLTDSFIPTPNTPEGEYWVRVKARDSFQNVSDWSNDAANPHKVTVDNTAPVSEFTTPEAGEEYESGITITGETTDNYSVDTVTLEYALYTGTACEEIDSADYQFLTEFDNTDNDTPYTWPVYNWLPEEVGDYCLKAHGVDLAGNEEASPTVLVNYNPKDTIFGYKFHDLDQDGLWDDGEPALENWLINLSELTTLINEETEQVSTTSSELYTATTSAEGYFEFTVPVGTYQVSEEQREGWEQTAPESGVHTFTVVDPNTIEGEATYSGNFGNYQLPEPTPTPVSDLGGGNDGNGGGGFSAPGPADPPVCSANAPGIPVGLSVTNATANTVTLNWTRPEGDVTHYALEFIRLSDGARYGAAKIGDGNTTSYTITNLSGQAAYRFELMAVNDCKPGERAVVTSTQITGPVINEADAGRPQGDDGQVLGSSTDESVENADGEIASGVSDNKGLLGSVLGASTENCSVPGWWWLILVGYVLGMMAVYALLEKRARLVGAIVLTLAAAAGLYWTLCMPWIWIAIVVAASILIEGGRYLMAGQGKDPFAHMTTRKQTKSPRQKSK